MPSLPKFGSAPGQAPPQRTCPSGQPLPSVAAGAQTPPVQLLTPHCSPQAPQFRGSACRLTQTPLQKAKGGAQFWMGPASCVATQRPPEQIGVSRAQPCPQAPQFPESSCRLTQASPHPVNPAAHRCALPPCLPRPPGFPPPWTPLWPPPPWLPPRGARPGLLAAAVAPPTAAFARS